MICYDLKIVPHVYQAGQRWANECICGEHRFLNRIHNNEWEPEIVGGLYGNGMHDFILRECEIGFRVAAAEESEMCGFGPLFDLQMLGYMKEHGEL